MTDKSASHRESIAYTDTSWGCEQYLCGEGIYPRSAAKQAQLADTRWACRNRGGSFLGLLCSPAG
ncbi:hypothetical protein, partial [Pseudomonas sp.]|uniref:hypothetical protein n=1 Tax=Pseudomonas sp. TaxID=306 RepID=UPI002355145B